MNAAVIFGNLKKKTNNPQKGRKNFMNIIDTEGE